MNMRVLIVDDEPLARDELAYLLGQCEGVSAIAQAESIEEALGAMLEEPMDLIFLDIHLTNESGLSLAGKINKIKNPPMIIFATAYDDYAVKAFELNATDYVLKPFELERIQQAVKKAYGQYRNQQIGELEPYAAEGYGAAGAAHPNGRAHLYAAGPGNHRHRDRERRNDHLYEKYGVHHPRTAQCAREKDRRTPVPEGSPRLSNQSEGNKGNPTMVQQYIPTDDEQRFEDTRQPFLYEGL